MIANKAFISYSHSADAKFVRTLHRELERFGKPWYRARSFRIFRDSTNLSISPELWPEIEKALSQSEFLLFLASPQASQSKWVRKELTYWRDHKDPSRLLIILTGGKIAWDDDAGDFDWTTTDAVPDTLSGVFASEPLYLDFTRFSDGNATLDQKEFLDHITTIAAPLHGRSKDEIYGEHLRQHRATMRVVAATIAILAMLTTFALYQWKQASDNLRQVESTLADSILQPIVPGSDLNGPTLDSLWLLAELPLERERVRFLFLEHALSRMESAAQLRSHAHAAVHAAVGFNGPLRERVLSEIVMSQLRQRRFQTDRAGLEIRLACVDVGNCLEAATGKEGRECARLACEVILAAIPDRTEPAQLNGLDAAFRQAATRLHQDDIPPLLAQLFSFFGKNAGQAHTRVQPLALASFQRARGWFVEHLSHSWHPQFLAQVTELLQHEGNDQVTARFLTDTYVQLAKAAGGEETGFRFAWLLDHPPGGIDAVQLAGTYASALGEDHELVVAWRRREFDRAMARVALLSVSQANDFNLSADAAAIAALNDLLPPRPPDDSICKATQVFASAVKGNTVGTAKVFSDAAQRLARELPPEKVVDLATTALSEMAKSGARDDPENELSKVLAACLQRLPDADARAFATRELETLKNRAGSSNSAGTVIPMLDAAANLMPHVPPEIAARDAAELHRRTSELVRMNGLDARAMSQLVHRASRLANFISDAEIGGLCSRLLERITANDFSGVRIDQELPNLTVAVVELARRVDPVDVARIMSGAIQVVSSLPRIQPRPLLSVTVAVLKDRWKELPKDDLRLAVGRLVKAEAVALSKDAPQQQKLAIVAAVRPLAEYVPGVEAERWNRACHAVLRERSKTPATWNVITEAFEQVAHGSGVLDNGRSAQGIANALESKLDEPVADNVSTSLETSLRVECLQALAPYLSEAVGKRLTMKLLSQVRRDFIREGAGMGQRLLPLAVPLLSRLEQNEQSAYLKETLAIDGRRLRAFRVGRAAVESNDVRNAVAFSIAILSDERIVLSSRQYLELLKFPTVNLILTQPGHDPSASSVAPLCDLILAKLSRQQGWSNEGFWAMVERLGRERRELLEFAVMPPSRIVDRSPKNQ